VLALLVESPAHGWALAAELARTGEVGKVWSVARPLVYRALETLDERGLIEAIGAEPGVRGPNRTIFGPTARGREVLREWLDQPVEHVRDVRSLFLLKLVLLERSGLPPEPLLDAQRALIEPTVASLESRLGSSRGSEAIVVQFRLETARAAVRFIDAVLREQARAASGRV
jgi:PadR family transcriptional regulator AphA